MVQYFQIRKGSVMRHRLLCGILLFVLSLNLAFTWPWEVEKKEAEKDKKESQRTTFQVKTVSREEAARSGGASGIPKVPKVYKIPKVHKVHKVQPKVYGTLSQDTPIVKVRNQIEEIIKINEGLKLQSKTQVREVQRITEQARIHRKILKDLAAVRRPEGQGGNESEMLRLQKIQLISSETEKNRRYLMKLREGAEDE